MKQEHDEEEEHEMPLRLFRAFGRAVETTLQEHEARCPARRLHQLPPLPTHPPAALPFPQGHIPDETLARMVEDIETEAADLATLALRYGHPPSLIARYLPAYQRRYRRWIAQQCTA